MTSEIQHCQIFLVFISPPHAGLFTTQIFFICLEEIFSLCFLWLGVILPFYVVYIIASTFFNYISLYFISTVWTARYPAMWRSKITPCSSRGPWPMTWPEPTSVTRPMASGGALEAWMSTLQVGENTAAVSALSLQYLWHDLINTVCIGQGRSASQKYSYPLNVSTWWDIMWQTNKGQCTWNS